MPRNNATWDGHVIHGITDVSYGLTRHDYGLDLRSLLRHELEGRDVTRASLDAACLALSYELRTEVTWREMDTGPIQLIVLIENADSETIYQVERSLQELLPVSLRVRVVQGRKPQPLDFRINLKIPAKPEPTFWQLLMEDG